MKKTLLAFASILLLNSCSEQSSIEPIATVKKIEVKACWALITQCGSSIGSIEICDRTETEIKQTIEAVYANNANTGCSTTYKKK